MSSSVPLDSIFQAKYEEFAVSLRDAFPELTNEIKQALDIASLEREALYKQNVMPTAGNPKRNPVECPGMVLPGVFLNMGMWNASSEGTKTAINQFLNILTFSLVMKDGGSDDFSGDAFKSWADTFMNQWRSKMDRGEFDSFTKRFADIFGSGGDRLPPFPEKLRKGKLVKLAEEIVKELKPEEFGLDPETVKQCEADPSKAFEVIMNSTMKNPEKLQGAMKRIVKRLQEKFQRGEFKPQELAAEAEEMMKEFSENPAFVEMMEAMRKMFSFDDMDSARASGHEHTARMNIVKERLRRKAAMASAMPQPMAQPMAQPLAITENSLVNDEFASILVKSRVKGNKKHDKK
jgi:hypothetical protein